MHSTQLSSLFLSSFICGGSKGCEWRMEVSATHGVGGALEAAFEPGRVCICVSVYVHGGSGRLARTPKNPKMFETVNFLLQ